MAPYRVCWWAQPGPGLWLHPAACWRTMPSVWKASSTCPSLTRPAVIKTREGAPQLLSILLLLGTIPQQPEKGLPKVVIGKGRSNFLSSCCRHEAEDKGLVIRIMPAGQQHVSLMHELWRSGSPRIGQRRLPETCAASCCRSDVPQQPPRAQQQRMVDAMPQTTTDWPGLHALGEQAHRPHKTALSELLDREPKLLIPRR